MPTKILAIDDSKTMRLAIKITFAAEDAKVTAVSKGSEAVARAKQMQADVVLVDHSLAPGEPSGFEVVQALKANPATAGIPVIMLIPAKGSLGEAEVSAAGADNFIGKPFDSQELIDKVATALGRKPAKAAASSRPSRPAAKAPAAKPPAAKPPVAKPPAARAPAARPPAAKPPASKPPAARVRVTPKPTPAVKPTPAAKPKTSVGGVRPPAAARPPAGRPAAAAQPSAGAAPGQIPIAVPIPFTAAGSPTPGMLERIKAAAGSNGAVAGLDPAAVKALLQLSQEVVEQVVWEVVPDLAEEIIKQKVQ